MDYKKLGISLIIPFIASLIGGLFTNTTGWYNTLEKPWYNPPGWVFGPVWTILYLMMGVALYLVWSSRGDKKRAYWFFGIQMGLNALWSILFFGLQNPLYAFIEIVVLWVFILMTLLEFYKINKKAGYLFVPYLLWVTFAAFLNFGFIF